MPLFNFCAYTIFLPHTRCCMRPGRGVVPNPAVALGPAQ